MINEYIRLSAVFYPSIAFPSIGLELSSLRIVGPTLRSKANITITPCPPRKFECNKSFDCYNKMQFIIKSTNYIQFLVTISFLRASCLLSVVFPKVAVPLTLTTRQARADDRSKNLTKCSKMSTFWNLVKKFRFIMRNALK